MKDVTIPVPEAIGPYRVVRPLAQGGMAAVFEVEDRNTNERLALKLLTQRGLAAPRFAREFRALTRLDHPNIVRVYRYGSHDGAPYLTMEMLDGRPVQVHAKSCGRPGDPVRTTEVLRVTALVADALDYLHARGMVHRDLKSANVLVLADARVKLLDFGTTRLSTGVTEITRAGEFVGTYAYASPEQITGATVDARSDIYSLGALFYRLCTGKRIFEAENPHELARMHVEKSPIPPRALVPALPEDVERLILQMVAKRPAGRPASAAEVARRIRGGAGRGQRRDRVVVSRPTRLVAREPELQEIRAHIDEARPGHMTLLVGTRGSGRAPMLKLLTAHARSKRYRVVGANFKVGQGGYGVLPEILADVTRALRRVDHQELQAELNAVRVASTQASQQGRPGAREERDFQLAAATLLARAASRSAAPVMVGLSKLNRASPLAIEAVRAIRQQLIDHQEPVLFLASTSEVDDLPGQPLRALLPDVHRVPLRPLVVEEVAELARSMLGGQVASTNLAARLHRVTGGLPGYVEEVLRSMVQEGLLVARRTGGSLTWVDRSEGRTLGPRSARATTLTQLAGLNAPSRRVIEALAVYGPGELGDLAHAADLEAGQVSALLEDLAGERLLRVSEEQGRPIWAFRLGLIRDLVQERMRSSRRHVLRQRLADLEQDRPASGRKVRLLAEAGRFKAAVSESLVWGEPMLEWGRAQELLPVLESVRESRPREDPPEDPEYARFHLLMGRTLAEVRPADRDLDEAFHRAAELAQGHPIRAEVDLYHARLNIVRGELESGLARLNRAYSRIAPRNDPRLMSRVARDIGSAQWLGGKHAEAEHWFRQAVDSARQQGAPREIARALVSQSVSSLTLGHLRDGEALLDEAIQLYEGVGDRHNAWYARCNLAEILRYRGRFSSVIEMLEPELRVARRTGTPAHFGHMILNVAESEVELHRLGQARERLAALTAELDPREHLHLCAGVALAQGRVAVRAQEYPNAIDILRPALDSSEAAGLKVVAPRLRAALGEALCKQGDTGPGEEALDTAARELEAAGFLPALGEALAAQARALPGQQDPVKLFLPVQQWLEQEPGLLVRMEYRVATAQHAELRGLPSRAHWEAARQLLEQVRDQLSAADQEALWVHPWAMAVHRGLNVELESVVSRGL